MTELEQDLVVLGRALDVPEAPDVSAAVAARLARPARLRGRTRRWRWAVAFALALLVALAATLAIPDARSALFRVFGIGGEQIVVVDELPAVRAPSDLESTLGERISLAQAQSTLGRGLRVLDERPNRTYVGPLGSVWLLYGTPERVRLLVAEMPEYRVERRFSVQKLAGPGTRVERVSVGGSPGLFLSGAPHVVLLVDRYGTVVSDSVRLVRDVLVWSSGNVTYRLEGKLSRDEALTLARKLHPPA